MTIDALQFSGRRAVVVGGSSGIGAATVRLLRDLGAEVVNLDVQAPADATPFIALDLCDRSSIEEAVDACGSIDALFSCAGVADGTPGLPTINFIGQRHLILRAVDRGQLGRGSAVAMVSSAGGRGWEEALPILMEYLTTLDFHAAETWIEAHPDLGGYAWSKRAVCGFVARSAYDLAKRGVRINSLMPGPTDTPLGQANADVWLAFASDYRDDIGLEAATPEEQAWLLAFLCSPVSSRLIGVNLMSDAGHAVSRLAGSFPPA